MFEHPDVVRLQEGYEVCGTGDIAALDDLFAEDQRYRCGRSRRRYGAAELLIRDVDEWVASPPGTTSGGCGNEAAR